MTWDIGNVTAETNFNADTKAEYPSGWRISYTITESSKGVGRKRIGLETLVWGACFLQRVGGTKELFAQGVCLAQFLSKTYAYIMDGITGRLDKIIDLIETIAKPPSPTSRILAGAAAGVGILGILSAIDIIKTWLGG
ncbi:hypothetical protein FACS1894137_16170 [Spirochaetia bacterium]|nr:hypothetical protein FACS1894137_16170 [Spirochaetia bacterium]